MRPLGDSSYSLYMTHALLLGFLAWVLLRFHVTLTNGVLESALALGYVCVAAVIGLFFE